jgi:DNA-directed RNA polymerase subunit RPC12/RpoP
VLHEIAEIDGIGNKIDESRREERGTMITKCPGQDTQFWGFDAIYSVKCPKCGHPVEFFKDDIRRRCPQCGRMFLNPKLNLGCARWCQFADQCVGVMDKEEFKELILAGMKEHYGDEQEKIDQALEVLGRAEEIMEQQEDVNPKVVIAAAALYGIGMGERGRTVKRGPAQDKVNFPTVRGILESAGAKDAMIEEVCRILENHGKPKRENTSEGKVVHEAYRLAGRKRESEAMGEAAERKEYSTGV